MKIFLVLCNLLILSFGINCLAAVELVKQTAVLEEENAELAKWKAEDAPSAEVVLAASKVLPGFLAVLDDLTLKEWKVSKESLGSASLGEPFRLWRITPEAVRKYRKGETVKSILSMVDLWYVPVIIDNEMRLMLAVGRKNSSSPIRAAGLGDYLLAKELKGVIKEWAKSKGHSIVLITARPGEYFFTVLEKDQYNLTLIPTLPYMKQHSTCPALDSIENVVEWLKDDFRVASGQPK